MAGLRLRLPVRRRTPGPAREGVQIFRDMWTTGSATLDGKHYQVEGARCAPSSLQGDVRAGLRGQRHPDLGGGRWREGDARASRREYADYTNFYDDAETFSRKSDVLRGHCREIGRDFDSIVRTGDFNVVIGETEADVEDRLRFHADLLRRGGVPEARIERQIANLRTQPAVGTPERIVGGDARHGAARHGLRILYFQEAAHDRSGIELFENTVAPELKN